MEECIELDVSDRIFALTGMTEHRLGVVTGMRPHAKRECLTELHRAAPSDYLASVKMTAGMFATLQAMMIKLGIRVSESRSLEQQQP